MTDPVIIPAAPGFWTNNDEPVVAWELQKDDEGKWLERPIFLKSTMFEDVLGRRYWIEGELVTVYHDPAKSAHTAPPAPTGASTLSAPRPAPVAPPPAPASGNLATGVATSMHGPSPQQYLNVTVEQDGRKLMLRFYWNSATQDAEWKQLFASFVRMCGVDQIHNDTDELIGHRVGVQFPADTNTRSLSGLDSIRAALGIEASDD